MRGDQDLWTYERIELLEKLWAEGATANAIAAQLGGLSRSAVLGKIFRLRLGISAAAPAKKGQSAHASLTDARSQPVPEGSDALPLHPALPGSLARRRRSKRDDQSESAHGAVSARRKSVLELTNNTCRWPRGNPGTARFFFCGAPDANLERGMPYCPSHMRLAYSAPHSIAETAKPVRAPPSVEEIHLASSSYKYLWRGSVSSPAPRWT
jgi:GcrA cell cycle regulator